ncbi:adenylate kinase [Bacillus taeanensis]|uniref:Adenylate kinase n=1 Tax=Bacillus taeanensis TaxID=273032 RepID=A0A366Y4K5_9BACI|nr:adenylate kinase [Bacillus taeanensis]RBW71131.1 adenylate kinase [Bacillus taeanensis]
MNLLIMGLPGAGKGTQAEYLSTKYNLPHISTGDMLRVKIKEETRLGLEAKGHIESGNLVPDEVMIGIILDRFNKRDCKKGFLLDGFPRTKVQAEELDKMLKELNRTIDAVIYIEVGQEKVVQRITGRRICKGCGASYHVIFNPPAEIGVCNSCSGQLIQRSDDNEETVRKRIEVNAIQHQSLLEYYNGKGCLFTVNGSNPINKVFTDIETILNNLSRSAVL